MSAPSSSRHGGIPRGRRGSGAVSPPRPKMLGTVLPQDSMRGLRNAPREVVLLPPPPPSAQPLSTSHERHIKLLAAAGRDLFRQGLAFDGVRPTKQEPRHPAVTPNLLSIPENDSVSTNAAAAPSELIVVVGGPLNERGEPGVWVANRIAMAIQLYWQVLLSFAHEDEEEEKDEDGPSPLCYVVPTGGESTDEGIVETEAIRNALVSTGVSPHHIVMDCTATSLVDNALQLVTILRHLHVSKVHVVTSAFHVARVRLCYEQILRSASDLHGVQLAFHGARDGLSAAERAERAALEQSLLQQAHAEIGWALQRLQTKAATSAGRSKANKTKKNQSYNNNQRRPTFHSDV